MTEKDILHVTKCGKYWVSNEGTKKEPNFHVWETGIVCSMVESAYPLLSLAVYRANYLSGADVSDTAKSSLPEPDPTLQQYYSR